MNKFYILLLQLLISTSLQAQISPAIDVRLQQIFDSVCKANNIKGASAAVLIPNVGIWKGAYGQSHAGVPIATSMQLGIGSNTKTYIATLMLKMQENGMLDLDDTIGTWIQNLPNINGQITLRQLLSHRSGIYNFTNNPDFTTTINDDFNKVWDAEDALQFIEAPNFAPGTAYEYSNSNYLIAGLIIEQVYGQSISNVLRSQLLQPNNLVETVFYPEENIVTSVPHVWSIHFPKTYLEDITQDYQYSHNAMFSLAASAGAIMATAEDNVKFWNKLMSGAIINSSSLSEMKTFGIIPSSAKKYGLGLFRIPRYNGRTVFGHGGTNIGFINENIVDSVTGVCISVLTNQDSVSNATLLANIISPLHRATLFPVSVNTLTSVKTEIEIYPNPASNYIDIEYNGLQATILYINDIAGKAVWEGTITAGIHHVNLNVAPGTYSVYLGSSNGRKFLQKLIVY